MIPVTKETGNKHENKTEIKRRSFQLTIILYDK